MVTTPPATPVTIPVPEIVATAGLLLLQVPPGVASDNGDEAPGHSLVTPVMEATEGDALTVFIIVADAVHPKVLVTV